MCGSALADWGGLALLREAVVQGKRSRNVNRRESVLDGSGWLIARTANRMRTYSRYTKASARRLALIGQCLERERR